MNTENRLCEIERIKLAAIEKRITAKFLGLLDLVKELEQVNHLHLFRENYGSFKHYCRERWAFDSSLVKPILQTLSMEYTKPVLEPTFKHIELINEFCELSPEERSALAKRVSLEVQERPMTQKLIHECKALFPEKCIN